MKVTHNFLSAQECATAYEYARNTHSWYLKSFGEVNQWQFALQDGYPTITEFDKIKWLDPESPFVNIARKIWTEHIGDRPYHMNRMAINGGTMGEYSVIHRDEYGPGDWYNDNRRSQKHRTFLLYLNPTWKSEWGGSTIFWQDTDCEYDSPNTVWQGKHEVERFVPETGLMLEYPSGRPHSVSPINTREFRITFTISGFFNDC